MPSPPAPPNAVVVEVEPGYLAIACAGVAPFSTASVRCITRPVEPALALPPPPELADVAAPEVLNSLEPHPFAGTTA